MSSSGKMGVLVTKRGRLKDAGGAGERGAPMEVERTPPVRRPLRREARFVVVIWIEEIKRLVQLSGWYVRRNSGREKTKEKKRERRKEVEDGE